MLIWLIIFKKYAAPQQTRHFQESSSDWHTFSLNDYLFQFKIQYAVFLTVYWVVSRANFSVTMLK